MSTVPVALPKQHIISIPGVCGGKPCVAGSRVRVFDIAVRAQGGESPDELLTHFPHLTLSDVYAALAYYYDNRQAIDAQAVEDDQIAERLQKSIGAGPLAEQLGNRGQLRK